MIATQVNLTERGGNVVISKKRKKVFTRICLRFLDFHHQKNLVFSKKKKRSSPWIRLRFFDFHQQNLVFFLKKKEKKVFTLDPSLIS